MNDQTGFAVDADAQAVAELDAAAQRRRRRRWKWPLLLFLATFASTWWVAVCHWQPIQPWIEAYAEGDTLFLRQLVLARWGQGLLYSVAILGVLGLHEAGHYVMTLFYRVPASPPIFIPFPLNPIGTMGAVIAMQGRSADRKEIFDIGIAGPLAGLAVALPIAWLGAQQLDLQTPGRGELAFQCPLLLSWLVRWTHHPDYPLLGGVWLSQLNPFFVAGWVGLLITGLNMVPVGQLDGGHITYSLFGRGAHWIARLIVVAVIAFMVYAQTFLWLVMTLFILLIGTDHPPSADDGAKLGVLRVLLGLASLAIPVLCFPPQVFLFP